MYCWQLVKPRIDGPNQVKLDATFYMIFSKQLSTTIISEPTWVA